MSVAINISKLFFCKEVKESKGVFWMTSLTHSFFKEEKLNDLLKRRTAAASAATA
jgi:hypothetical protein